MEYDFIVASRTINLLINLLINGDVQNAQRRFAFRAITWRRSVDAEISVRCDIAQRIYVSPSWSRGLIHN